MSLALKRLKTLIGSNISSQTFFSSEIFKRNFSNVAGLVSKRYNNFKLKLNMVFDTEDETIAYTDNQSIFINLANSITSQYNSLEDKYLSLLGFLGHELGHVLYTNFDDLKNITLSCRKNKWYPYTPQCEDTDFKTNLNDLELFFKQNNLSYVILNSLIHNISNIVEDKYVNKKMSSEFTGTFKTGINDYCVSKTIDSYRELKLTQGLKTDFSLSDVLMEIHYFLFTGTRLYDELKLPPGLEKLLKSKLSTKHTDRIDYSNKILIYIWSYIKSELDNLLSQINNNSGSGQGGQGSRGNCSGISMGIDNSSSSEDSEDSENSECSENIENPNKKSENIENSTDSEKSNNSNNSSGSNQSSQNNPNNNSLKQAMDEATSSLNTTQVGSGQGVLNQQSDTDKQENGDEKNSDSFNQDNVGSTDTKNIDENDIKSLSEMFDAFAKDFAQKHEEEISSMNNKDLANDIKLDDNDNISQVNTKVNSYNKHYKNEYDYNSLYAELKGISKKLQRGILEVVDEKQSGTMQRSLLFGNKIDTASVASNNGRVFKKSRLPDNETDLVVSLLLDESGSMAGERIYSVRTTAIIIEDFCRKMNIPCCIVGHHTSGNDVVLNDYVDFETSHNGKNKYCLPSINAGGCNHDGVALRYMIKKLRQREEPSRILILVSDGAPNHNGYSGSYAKQDLSQLAQKCKKENIIFIAAGIGNDKAVLKDIYGDAYLDISDLNRMPIKMIKIIKRLI